MIYPRQLESFIVNSGVRFVSKDKPPELPPAKEENKEEDKPDYEVVEEDVFFDDDE